MRAKILDGKATAAAIKAELRVEVDKLKANEITPGLATILVGEDPGSQVYVRNKHLACEEVGIYSRRVDLPVSATQTQVLAEIEKLNDDSKIHSYLIQHPVPDQIDFNELLTAVDPKKDADGLHPVNLGYLALGATRHPRPCTPIGIVELLNRHGVQIEGAHVAVVGRGMTVGRPLAMLLSIKEPGLNATVTQCHTGTKDVGVLTRQADIVVAAVGRAYFLTADLVKPGAAVVDVGLTRTDDGIKGDVYPDVANVAGWISPVPGGVGPMTIAMLLKNTVAAALTYPS